MKRQAVSMEDRGEEFGADALDRLTDPFASLSRVAQTMGDDPKSRGLRRSLERFIDRMRQRGAGTVIDRAKQVKTQDLIDLLDTNSHAILSSIDELDLAEASLKDKAIAAGIMLEKRALLRGEPTQILSYEERKNLTELMPALMQEMERRGMTVELTPAEYEEVPEVRSLPPETIQLEAVSATARRMRSAKSKVGARE